jgi:hypothetical protein
MSWDVCIIKADGYRSFCDLPKGYDLGSADQVKEKLAKVYPTIVWTSPKLATGDSWWGSWEDRSEGYSIEFNLSSNDPVEWLALHIRGGGRVVPKIVELCREHGWKAIDTSTGDFIDLDNPSSKGWESFQAYRDHVFKRS